MDAIQVASEQNTKSETDTLEIGRESILAQSAALANIANLIGPEFDEAVRLIVQSIGRVIVIGMGKSGIVGQKIAATLASTGTPSFSV